MKKSIIALSLLSLVTINANASVVLGGTRVIYEGDKKEASISVRNNEKTPYYVSFGQLVVGNKELDNPGMVPPMAEASWNISGIQANQVTWNAVNDHGSITDNKTQTLK